MERGFDFVILLDIYGELLSKGQREALDMRYNADLATRYGVYNLVEVVV